MRPTFIILLGMAILAFVVTQRRDPARFQHLKGWQKFVGLVAFVLALLIIINPEFLALGLLGDAAFFDVLVLTLSLQMQVFAVRAWHWLLAALASSVRRVRLPSPGLSYLLTLSTLAFASAVSAIQKVIHRISS